jgi:glyoxylase-like metal-dependent hydrolase (beta-lactamase superfamily II)
MRVVTLPAHNPGAYTGTGSNTYFLPGAVPTLVDAGSGEPRHLDDVAAALVADAPEPGRGALAQVLVTHAHVDHAGGAAALAARHPAARFSKAPWPGQDARYPVPWTPLADGDMVPAGDTSLWVVATPGHAPDHLCFFEPRSGTLFAGDLVVNGGTVVIPASMDGSLSAYLRSLRVVLDLGPRRIYPGHGAPIDRPASLLRGYIAHRLSREQQVVEALSAGPLGLAALAARVYPGLDPALAGAASESLLAHLHKLREEGRAVCEGPDEAVSPWRID